ncbi:hypothetical protein ACFLZ6_01630 [Nanoarchaeota archaeon]
MKTREQIKGTKFEVWLEWLLKYHGFQNVARNLQYRRQGRPYRQVDLAYNVMKEGMFYTVVVEAKYSSNGEIPYKLRTPKTKKRGQQVIRLDNLVDELAERQSFVGAHESCLVTNHTFSDDVKVAAKRYGMGVIESPGLQQLYSQTGRSGTIDDSINSVVLKRIHWHKRSVYLR